VTERFAVRLSDRDKAKKALEKFSHIVEVDDGGAQSDAKGNPQAVLIVTSADEVEDPTPAIREAFAQSIGDALSHAGIEQWEHVAGPTPYVDEGGVRKLRNDVREQMKRPQNP
jgi:hypothetical protein